MPIPAGGSRGPSDAERPLPALGPRVSLLYLSLYLHYGFYAFLPVWLGTRGLSPALIGVLMAIPLVLRILTVAPVAAFVGRRAKVRVALLASAVASVGLMSLLGLTTSTVAVAITVLVFSFVWDQIPVLTDAYAVLAVRRQNLDFGRLRVWGSIAAVVASAAGGWIIAQLHISAVPLLIGGLLLAPAAAALWLPTDRRLVGAPDPGELGRRIGWRSLFADRPLIAGMLAASLVVGSQGVLNSFGAIQWSASGLSSSVIGLLNATAVVSELAFFWFGRRLLGARDPRLMLVLASVAAAIRWFTMASGPTLPVLFAVQLLQGVSATGAILGTMLLIGARTPAKLIPAAQGLNAVLLGAVLAAVTVGSGLLWTKGPAAAYLAMAATALLAIVALAALREPASKRT